MTGSEVDEMIVRLVERRSIARGCLIVCVAGLLALASLAFWSIAENRRTTATVRGLNDISNAWDRVVAQTNAEDDAVGDVLQGGSTVEPSLTATIGAAKAPLRWLVDNGEAEDASAALRVGDTYASFVRSTHNMLSLRIQGASWDEVSLKATEARRTATLLRGQISVAMTAQRQEIADHLVRADRANIRLQWGAAFVTVVDITLLALCAAILLSYQQRIERQAAASRHDATHDSLTGLANRSELEARAEAMIGANRPGAFLVIDLDRFKQVNDVYGHHHGDLLLQVVAERIRATIRAEDTGVRLGGDEFAVLAPAIVNQAEATGLAGRLLDALTEPMHLEGVELTIGASIGVALYPAHAQTLHELSRHADTAMYVAKRDSLGVVVFSQELTHNRAADRPMVTSNRP